MTYVVSVPIYIMVAGRERQLYYVGIILFFYVDVFFVTDFKTALYFSLFRCLFVSLVKIQ